MRHFPDFLEAYQGWTSHHEASKRIHLWSAISVLAGAMERKIFMNRGYYELYPNLYIFIVGASGLVKKSTSTGIAVSLLRELPNIQMMSDRVTASSLIEQISKAQRAVLSDEGETLFEHTSMFIYASELIVFVKEVFGSVVELLTTFWDSPKLWVYKTKHHGSNVVKGVCLNMLAATTIQWLRQGITAQIMNAGFAGRVIFVCENKKPERWVAWPTPPKNYEHIREKLSQDLLHIHNLHGEMKPTDECRELFDQWYQIHMNFVADHNQDVRLNGYYGRKGEMLLKIAMIKSISEGDSFVVEKQHLEWALQQVDQLEPDLVDIYTPPKADPEIDTKFQVLDFVRKKKVVPLSTIRLNFTHKLNGLQVDRALQDLLAEERITTDAGAQSIKSPQTIFKFNEAISSVWD